VLPSKFHPTVSVMLLMKESPIFGAHKIVSPPMLVTKLTTLLVLKKPKLPTNTVNAIID
jgi:hypothetical protein